PMIWSTVRKPMLLLVTLVLPLSLGCGGRGEIKVTGKVTIDSEPVRWGSIMFTAEDDTGDATSADIVAGDYKADVVPGKKKYNVKVLGVADPAQAQGREGRRNRVTEMKENRKATSQQSKAKPPGELIGNNQVVEISAENPVLNIDLKTKR